MLTAYVSDKGRITIPAQVRRQLGIKPGTKIEVELRDNEIVLKPVKSIMDVYGILHEAAKGKTDDWETVRRKTMEAVAREVVNEDRR